MATMYRGQTIRRTIEGNYVVAAFGSAQQAASLATAKRWIDQAIGSGELTEPREGEPHTTRCGTMWVDGNGYLHSC